MNIKNCINEFNKYVKNYDLKNPDLMLKFHHTYRVMEYAKEISESINYKDKDTVMLGALLHDIGRFEQYKTYLTYEDSKSVDHGDFGYDILIKDNLIDKFVIEKDKETVLNVVKYHNKYNIDNLKDNDYLITSIIRDADKLDIIIELNNEIKDNKLELKKEIVEQLKKQEMCSNKLMSNDIDYVLRSIGFIFDLNYKYSFKLLKEKHIIENKFKLLETYININDEYLELKNNILEYIEKRI